MGKWQAETPLKRRLQVEGPAPEQSPSFDRSDEGARRPLIAAIYFLVPVAPLMIAGAIRAAAGAPLLPALGCSVALTATLLLLHRRTLRLAVPLPKEGLALLLGACAAAAMLALFYSGDFGALVTVGGGDAGNHVSLQGQFANQTSNAYSGFVTFYSVTWLLQRGFGVEQADSFAFALYLRVALVPLCAAAAAAALMRGLAPKGWAVGIGALALLLGAGVLRLWGPWLHYQQADGFYAHLFGLVPLLFFWCAYSVAATPFWRVAAIAGLVVISRFTYGLNLGDLLVTAAVVLALESRGSLPRWAVGALRAAALLAAAGALLAYRALLPLRLVEHGSIVAADVRQLLVAQALMAAFLALSWWQLRGGRGRTGSATAAERLLALPVLFGLTSLLVQVLYVVTRSPQRYYFLKYSLHPVVWMSVAVVAVLPWLVGRLIERKALRVTIVQAAAGAAALLLIASATHPHWYTFRERAFGAVPYQHIDALTDPALVRHLRQILARERATSGGVIDPSWPRSNFINASVGSFDAYQEGEQRFAAGIVVQRQGSCVFWLEGDPVLRQFEQTPPQSGTALVETWNSLRTSADKQCVPHRRAWLLEPEGLLCHRCGPPMSAFLTGSGAEP